MTFALALHILVGLSPVLGFLAALVFLDSYKLVAMRTVVLVVLSGVCLLYTSPSPRDRTRSRMPSSA